jgi:propanediol dehydratase small subunit
MDALQAKLVQFLDYLKNEGERTGNPDGFDRVRSLIKKARKHLEEGELQEAVKKAGQASHESAWCLSRVNPAVLGQQATQRQEDLLDSRRKLSDPADIIARDARIERRTRVIEANLAKDAERIRGTHVEMLLRLLVS